MMFDFSPYIDLGLIWVLILGFAIFMYVFLDGFVLGVGILFPFAPSCQERDKMMRSASPFWDANQTWLVLGGGGLFAAFPMAYGILLSAFYIPLIAMLLCLIFRGIAFEFRFKASDTERFIWDYSFHFGSLGATFFQGCTLGAFVQGVAVDGRNFAGHSFDWVSGFSIMIGIALIFGYALLGATWLIMKTEGELQKWARQSATYVMVYVGLFMIFVSVAMPLIRPEIALRWFSSPTLWFLLPMPVITAVLFFTLLLALKEKHESTPFFTSILLFFMGYIGLGVSFYPYIIPFNVTLWEAAANSKSLSLMFVGAVIVVPCILAYTLLSYYVFKGKVRDEEGFGAY